MFIKTVCVVVGRFSLKEDNKKGGKNTLVCIACHPKDDCIATGHEDGKIRLWWVTRRPRRRRTRIRWFDRPSFEQLFSLNIGSLMFQVVLPSLCPVLINVTVEAICPNKNQRTVGFLSLRS